MTGDREGLVGECATFTRLLVGDSPTPYVIDKYVDAHERLALEAGASRFDHTLVGIARRGTIAAKVADAYAALRAPQSLLRKKLVTLLAILETSPPAFRRIDEVGARTAPGLLLRLGGRAAAGVLAAAVGLLLLLPLHVILGDGDRGGGR